jgi:hypothetical protein
VSAPERPTFSRHALLAACVGVVLAFATLDPWFLLGVGAKWQNPTGDLTAYMVASTYYLHDSWHFPLWSIPKMGYPEGGSIVYNDAIPIAALPTKLLTSLTGWHINYLGPWVVLCYALQAVLAARLAFVLGNRSLLATGAFAVFATACAAFMLRIQHTALCAHFLILWAFLAYLRLREPDVRLARVALPPVLVTFLVNPYLFAMVTPIVAAGVVSQWRTPSVRRQFLPTIAIAGVIWVAVIVAGGFIPQSGNVGHLGAAGFGHASWNPASMVVPPPLGFWMPVTIEIVRDATSGQYEGESYLGFLPVILLVLWLWLSPREALERIRRHPLLFAVLAGMAIFALSDHAFLRSMTLWDIQLPRIPARLASVFRMSGRFIWPLMYLLIILPGVYLLRRFPRTPTVAVLLCGAVFQIVELNADRDFVRLWTASPSPDLVNVRVLSPLMEGHTRLWQYPSWFCGGLGSQAVVDGMPREYQLQVLEAQADLPSNSIYMSRPLKDCEREKAEAASLTMLEPGVLYVFSKDVIAGLPRVQALTASAACRDLGWGWVCSRRLGTELTQAP